MEDLKNGLRNAGFVDSEICRENNKWVTYLSIGSNEIEVSKSQDDKFILNVCIYFTDGHNEKRNVFGGNINHLEELNKICYPFNDCQDLNFEGK